ncbi:hypothetical protein BC629DRAFT_1552549 [Irpex lacteus]|nr:hypothetical protein BC629DRAFT_1552549 [Irpex lacteus]
MVFLGTFLAVVSVLFNIVVKLPLPLPVSYRLALSGLETAICGPPPLLPYFSLYALPAAVVPSVVVNTDLFGAAVFHSTLTGCLVNCTLVDEPAPVYFGPHLPPPGPLIVAPSLSSWHRPLRVGSLLPTMGSPFMFSDLLTLRNLVYLGMHCATGLLALKRRLVSLVADIVVSFYAQPTPPPQAPVATYGLSRFEDFCRSHPITRYSTDEDSASVASSDDDESAAIDEEPLPLPATSSPSVPSVCRVDGTPIEPHPTQGAAISDDVAAAADDELAHPSLSSAAVVVPDNVLVVEFEHCNVGIVRADKLPQRSASPAEESGAATGSVVDKSVAPQVVVPTTADAAVASSSAAPAMGNEEPVKPKRPTRSGKKCKALRRQREREAEAAAAAANPEAPQAEGVLQEPVTVESDVVEEPLTREERRRQRKLRARAAAQEASSSSAVLEPEGPVFTDDDFPLLPVEPVTPKPLEHRMSYALVTAVSRPSVTAVIHVHRPPPSTLPVEVDALPRFKWIAASRQYEDMPQDSVWTNWTMDLEDMATFRYAKKTRRKKKD